MRNPHIISGRSAVNRGVFGHFEKNAKDMRLPAIFKLDSPSMWCFDWAEILCGNVSKVEEHPLKILRDLHARFGRCFRTRGGSWVRCARLWDIWRAVALSERTSLRHREIGPCVFSEIFYSGSWGGMRNPHKISGQSDVV